MINDAIIGTVIVLLILGSFIAGSCSEDKIIRDRWCAANFSRAATFADSLAVVRDTLPRGCKIVIEGKP